MNAIFPTWRKIVHQNPVSGRQVHTARLVACIETNQIHSILTFNESDFRRYPHIEVLTPL